MQTKIFYSGLKQDGILLEVPDADIALVTEHPSTLFGCVIMVNSQLPWFLNFSTAIALISSLSTFSIVLFKSNSMIFFQLPVFVIGSIFILIFCVPVTGTLFSFFWIVCAPIFHPLQFNIAVAPIAIKSSALVRTKFSLTRPREFLSAFAVSADPLKRRHSSLASPIRHVFLATNRAVDFLGIGFRTLKVFLAHGVPANLYHRKIITENY
jgi:hypothetical protein